MSKTVPRFQHLGLIYDDEAEFYAAAQAFLIDASELGAATLVVLSGDKVAKLRRELPALEGVEYVDTHSVGTNPGRWLTQWCRFVDAHPERPIRGLGEPSWPGRSPEESMEVRLHEHLLNLAFDPSIDLTFLCPYDGTVPEHRTSALSTHPEVMTPDGRRIVGSRNHREQAQYLFGGNLTPPPDDCYEVVFGNDLRHVRDAVRKASEAGGLRDSIDDAVFCANELATNTLVHGGGQGTLRVWSFPGGITCEVVDSGTIDDLFVGRYPPDRSADGGRGLWMVNQLCDLVQVRSGDGGTTARMILSER